MNFDTLASQMTIQPAVGRLQLDQISEDRGVYTAWRKGDSHCFYAGKADNLRNRIRSHYAGQRGGDQFACTFTTRFCTRPVLKVLRRKL
jgi:hypothetical protein